MSCHFCEDIFDKNKELGLPKEDSIIFEDEHIYVMPDICPLFVGHMLIVTKEHFQGYANAGTSSIQSVEKFLTYYKARIGNRSFTIFEHGAVLSNMAGASVDHAHIHILPLQLEMNTVLDCVFLKHVYTDLEGLTEFAKEEQPYIFYRSGNETQCHVYPVFDMESQFLRKIAAEFIGKNSSYNWRKDYRSKDAYIEFYKTLLWWRSLEMPSTFKWKKRLIMERYEFLTYRDLLEEVIRLPVRDKHVAIKLIEKELEDACKRYARIVLVPMNHQYKLPNYIVTGKKDLTGAERFLDMPGSCQEIWLFFGTLQFSPGIFSGRISYNWSRWEYTGFVDEMEVIEIVSGDDPRQIEKYIVQNSNVDYLRAVKRDKNFGYIIEACDADAKYRQEKELIWCFEVLKKELDKFHVRLYEFKKMIRRYGGCSFSMDFKIINQKILFLDWDTSDDAGVLKNQIG